MFNFPVAPAQASNFAAEHDAIFYALTALTILFTAIVGIMVLFFVMRYRRGSAADRSNPVHDHLKIELTWTIIPTILGLIVFAASAQLFIKQRIPPKDAMEIFVIGKQWMWHLQHTNGVRENNELHIPVGTPIKLTMISQDVIHGFYIPAFRVQYHVVPGRYSQLWFTATKPGKYNLFCTIHCGTQHSEMGGFVYVMPKAEFAQWLANGGNRFKKPPQTIAQAGESLYKELACGNCHGAADEPRGPTLYGLYGRRRQFADGSTAVADEDYIRESIINPYRRVTAGYTENTMPVYVYRQQVDEEQLRSLIEYIKTLGAAPAPVAAGKESAGLKRNTQ